MSWFTISPKQIRHLTDIAASSAAEKGLFPEHNGPIMRSIRPDDVELIVTMHQRLSERTIYSRYHSPRVPTRQEIAQICQLGGENGHAVVAVIGGKQPAVVGMAYYIVSEPDTAEAALLVEDGYQGQGIGQQLLNQLAGTAAAHGICFFNAYVLPTNKPMIHLLFKMGRVIQNRLDYGAREIRIQLTAVSTRNFTDAWMPGKESDYLTI